MKEKFCDKFNSLKCYVYQTTVGDMIVKSLELFSANIAKYYPSLETSTFDRMRNSFIDMYDNLVMT